VPGAFDEDKKVCTSCKGTGRDKCHSCGGSGTVKIED
jgi:DnaJ-class molecular chaperone